MRTIALSAVMFLFGAFALAQLGPNTPSVTATPSTAPSTNCPSQAPPLSGVTYWCFGGDGKVMVSVNGAAYVAWPGVSVSPITGITLGGVAQTPLNGIVALPKYPTTATGTLPVQ